MRDVNERMREIFDQRRRKQNNWPRLIIMIIILVALIVGISMLNKAAESGKLSIPAAEYHDSTAVDAMQIYPDSLETP